MQLQYALLINWSEINVHFGQITYTLDSVMLTALTLVVCRQHLIRVFYMNKFDALYMCKFDVLYMYKFVVVYMYRFDVLYMYKFGVLYMYRLDVL